MSAQQKNDCMKINPGVVASDDKIIYNTSQD